MSEQVFRRYFIVFYNFLGEKSEGCGETTMVTTSDSEEGAYLNRGDTKRILKEKLSKTKYAGCDPIVTNIIEVKESDYLDWIRAEEKKEEKKEEESPLMIDVKLSDEAMKEIANKFDEGWDEDEICDHLVFEGLKPTPKTTDDELKYLVQTAIRKIVTGE